MSVQPDNVTNPPWILSALQQAWLLQLAREAIHFYLKHGKTMRVETAVPALLQPAGVFVTLRSLADGLTPKAARLRGCIGHVEADWPLAEVVASMAVKSATRDPRFPPVTLAELDQIAIEISILSPAEPVESIHQIELGRHGLIISDGYHRGLLLPQVPLTFGWTREEFLENLCRKAGMPRDAWHEAELSMFTTAVIEESAEG